MISVNDVKFISKKIFVHENATITDLEKDLFSADFPTKQIFMRMVLTTLYGLHILSNGKNSIFDIICRSDGIIYLLEDYFSKTGIKLQIDYSQIDLSKNEYEPFCFICDINENISINKKIYHYETFLSYHIYTNNNNFNNGLTKLNRYEAVFFANGDYYVMRYNYKNTEPGQLKY